MLARYGPLVDVVRGRVEDCLSGEELVLHIGEKEYTLRELWEEKNVVPTPLLLLYEALE